VILILGIDFGKKKGLTDKIHQIINGLKFSLAELKVLQKNLGTVEFEGNNANPQNKEVLNYWLHLEHNRNMALVERQRQRAT
jgi:hypothetical protein